MITRIKDNNLKKEYKEKLKTIIERNKIIIKNIDVLFYQERHKNCPLGFDLILKDNSLILDVSLYQEEEPSLFWETVEEEINGYNFDNKKQDIIKEVKK